MKFSRPDVACNASRFGGPLDIRQTKAQWMQNLNEDSNKGMKLTKRSQSLNKFVQIGHGTWSHFSYGDPVGSFKTDRALYGDTEARRRHLARAEASGVLWQHPEAVPPPLPSPAASSKALRTPERPPSVRLAAPAAPELTPAAPPAAVSPEAPRSEPRCAPARPPPHPGAASLQERERQSPPQLPQLWASQPRILTPNTPLAASSRRSASVTPSSVVGSHIAERLSTQPLRPPLRRMDSDPGFHR